ncbi:hypothetical protein O6P43_029859 [Quillaja saponaria]|uniref:Uncharacterized protein n=1 Tax=Quillaja saponaria TaxID=32244 RepID=A0AAD7L288_QUISA|nr:hypothetical protein O6P43_029859 [Quillaja saponaria]
MYISVNLLDLSNSTFVDPSNESSIGKNSVFTTASCDGMLVSGGLIAIEETIDYFISIEVGSILAVNVRISTRGSVGIASSIPANGPPCVNPEKCAPSSIEIFLL